ncbi:MAG: alpha/beta fold hydrolase [Acidobacteriota bacterium]
MLLQGGCISHYIIHPRQLPQDLEAWQEEREVAGLIMRFEWVLPAGEGPLPTVIVHPEANHFADEMRGILYSLAQRGYAAVAADYRRANGETLFTWKRPEDARAVYEIVRQHPRVDGDRLGWMGYSQGGIYSLLIAARTPAAAVVAYYPVTDFETWLEDAEGRGLRRLVFRAIRRYFRKKSGAESEEEYRRLLRQASPYHQAESITAPVLLIHGARDRSARLSESRRLAERLRELDREVRLVVLDDAGHVFNFRNQDKAARAWQEATAWLDRHLRGEAP